MIKKKFQFLQALDNLIISCLIVVIAQFFLPFIFFLPTRMIYET
jgi:hypothetical protein